LKRGGEACFTVAKEFLSGGMSVNGYIRAQSDTDAARFFRMGCSYDYVPACSEYGKLLMAGRGVVRDERAGAALVITACDSGYRDSCRDAARVLTLGIGVPSDRSHAIKALDACGSPCRDFRAREHGTGTVSSGLPPPGAAGFLFGLQAQEAEARCRAAGHTWSRQAQGIMQCSGSVGSPLPFRVDLSFCQGAVCSVALLGGNVRKGAPAAKWLEHESELIQSLVDKYGLPGARVYEVPESCYVTDESFWRCIASGKVAYMGDWSWTNGTRIFVSLETGPHIRIEYSTAQAMAARRASGL